MINRKQRIHLMGDLWPAACKHQGWDRKDDARRYSVFARVLGHMEPHKTTLAEGGNISSNDFVSAGLRDDFGAVKAELQRLAADNLLADDQARRRLLWIIQERLMPCYRLYRPEAGLETILRERFARVRGVNGVEDLTSENLEKLIFTLEARVHSAMTDAGETHHSMCKAAGVKRWKPCPKYCWLCAEELAMAAGELAEVEEPF